MSWTTIGFLSTLFIGFTVLNRIAEGYFLKVADVSVMNALSISHNQNILGIVNVPVLNLQFFTVGLPRLMSWDYSFFSGDAAMISYLFSAISSAVAFGLFITIGVGMISQFLSGRR